MLVNFYIIPESFSSNKSSLLELTYSLEAFLEDYYRLREYQVDNKIFLLNDVYSAMLTSDGLILSSYLFDISSIQGKERERRITLRNILMKIPSMIKCVDDVKNEIENNSEICCTGIISMTPIENIADAHQIIYDKNTWFDFRRFHLGLFPFDFKNFIDECIKYYPSFFFHENNYNSIKPILKGFSQKIIYHLSALHDVFPKAREKYPMDNHTELLKKFSAEAKLDQDASLQGKSKSNGNFEFNFTTFCLGKLNVEKLICEPHLKLCKNDADDGKFYDHRIYFHFGKSNIHNGSILIAHIGVHL